MAPLGAMAKISGSQIYEGLREARRFAPRMYKMVRQLTQWHSTLAASAPQTGVRRASLSGFLTTPLIVSSRNWADTQSENSFNTPKKKRATMSRLNLSAAGSVLGKRPKFLGAMVWLKSPRQGAHFAGCETRCFPGENERRPSSGSPSPSAWSPARPTLARGARAG